jgi:Asp-tRNA(Asn)/Glu-tRNA(Gln) amidotransferase A subunit family amidase
MLTAEPATTLARLVQSGEVTASEIVAAYLERIAAIDAAVGAFQIVRADRAIGEAAALMDRGDRRELPLAGVPVAIKDNVSVEGEPMRVGSLATTDRPGAADHETVRRLRSAGAIVVGITRVPEFCIWGTTDSAFGVTRNPWNLQRTAGGSSGAARPRLRRPWRRSRLERTAWARSGSRPRHAGSSDSNQGRASCRPRLACLPGTAWPRTARSRRMWGMPP